ncbi:MAG: hypothetical protein BWY99_00338 [Synergistetes bacterium ADurb.BinA166]|nr:MAG: hypothetical protein BWY99_00338 [Synergistetes bacterium ADurb.BinA166]
MILLNDKCDHLFKGCPTRVHHDLLSAVVPHWVDPLDEDEGENPIRSHKVLLCGHCMSAYDQAEGDPDVTDVFDARWVKHRYSMKPMTFGELAVFDVTES